MTAATKECVVKTFEDTSAQTWFFTAIAGEVVWHNEKLVFRNVLHATCGSQTPTKGLLEGTAGVFVVDSAQGFYGLDIFVDATTRNIQRITFYRANNKPPVSIGALPSENTVLINPAGEKDQTRQMMRLLSRHEDCGDDRLFLVGVEAYYQDAAKQNVVTEQGAFVRKTRSMNTRPVPSGPPKALPRLLAAKPTPLPHVAAPIPQPPPNVPTQLLTTKHSTRQPQLAPTTDTNTSSNNRTIIIGLVGVAVVIMIFVGFLKWRSRHNAGTAAGLENRELDSLQAAEESLNRVRQRRQSKKP